MKRHGQMSEAVSTGIFLTLSGGFQDAYTYYTRGKVFANAQTGNIILLGHNAMNGDFTDAFRYLVPVLAFAGGIYISEVIRGIYREYGKLHWRQIVVVLEILLLFVVGFLPQSMNMAANILVSFVCAMQVEAFRKMKGSAYASTMCIGNLRSATEMLYRYRHTKENGCLEKCLRYYGVILVFGIGAALGSFMTSLFEERTIWISCGFLFVCFCIMLIPASNESGGRACGSI
ncbi:YoaK family protein [Hungatella effluvii]|uniref:YoaK family protein n=1 Tax=Hungatella effluvii TaxID=1096246 RepID=UPI0022E4B718|nr:YoaK family protein [Hungatella effluvii]